MSLSSVQRPDMARIMRIGAPRIGPARVEADLRLNVGCGPDGPQGWTNIDRSPHIVLDRLPLLKRLLYRTGVLVDAHMTVWPRSTVYGDVCKGLPYRDGSASAI